MKHTTNSEKLTVALYSTGHSWPFPLCDLLRTFYPGDRVVHIDRCITEEEEIKELVKRGEIEEVALQAAHPTGDKSYYSHYDATSGILTTGKVGSVGNTLPLGRNIKNYNRDQKNAIKRALYEVLASEFEPLPWGMLTGVRPSSVLLHADDTNSVEADATGDRDAQIAFLESYYGVSKSRAALAVDVARVEKPVVQKGVEGFSLYIHIPFCPSRCDYCSFPTLLSANRKEEIAAYADQLVWEMQEMQSAYAGHKLQNIYIGGGTPATMSVADLEKVLSQAHSCFDTSELEEVTVEVGRPELVTEELLTMLTAQGVDRISINPQTMQQPILDVIGRRHSVEDVYHAFSVARKFPSLSVNLDLIIGLPGDDKTTFLDTLDQVTKLQPENLTMHTMSIKKGSVYEQLGVATFVAALSRIQEMCDLGRAFAKKHNYMPYYLYRQKNMIAPLENVGYCKNGHVNRYNILMMQEKHLVLGIGMGATSKFPNSVTNGVKTILNYRNLRDYMGKSKTKNIERQRAMREIVY